MRAWEYMRLINSRFFSHINVSPAKILLNGVGNVFSWKTLRRLRFRNVLQLISLVFLYTSNPPTQSTFNKICSIHWVIIFVYDRPTMYTYGTHKFTLKTKKNLCSFLVRCCMYTQYPCSVFHIFNRVKLKFNIQLIIC